MTTIIQRPSPNFDTRGGVPIDILLLHYTGMKTAEEALDRLCDADARVSAHYVVDQDGTIIQLVDEAERAWHAGASYWAGQTNINACSIGIEIVNPGHEWGYTEFPDVQMQAVIDLSQGILDRHPIPPHRVLAHSDVAPSRKEDPGEKFDWAWAALEGVGLWVDPEGLGIDPEAPGVLNTDALRQKLSAFGYDAVDGPDDDQHLRHIVTAFQRHYDPAMLGQPASIRTLALADALLGHIPSA